MLRFEAGERSRESERRMRVRIDGKDRKAIVTWIFRFSRRCCDDICSGWRGLSLAAERV
jgi:hypothetical protein